MTGQVSACWKLETSYSIKSNKLVEIWDSNEYKEITEQALQGKCSGCLFACYSEESI